MRVGSLLGDGAKLEANLARLGKEFSADQSPRRNLAEATRERIIRRWPWALPGYVEIVP